MHTVWPKIDPTSENHIQPESYLCFLSTSGDVFTGLSACNVIKVVIFIISYSDPIGGRGSGKPVSPPSSTVLKCA